MSDTKQLAFSAAQIDAILAAAQRCSNRNLLDNWYFVNPVDQRGGYVVPPDTPYYSDTGLSTQVGTVNAYTKAVKVNDTYCTITVGSTTYYVAWSAAVRGYTSDGYTIDRWKMNVGGGTVALTIEADGIVIHVTPNAGEIAQANIFQIMTPDRNQKGTHALSFLYSSNVAVRPYVMSESIAVLPGYADFPASSTPAVATIHYVLETDAQMAAKTWCHLQVNTDQAAHVKLYAAKSELGSQQTLAHQDENGNWVLNEIPDYGEQLARCQRYYQLYSSADKRPVKTVDCRPTMRVDPVQGTIVIDGTTYYYNSAEL